MLLNEMIGSNGVSLFLLRTLSWKEAFGKKKGKQLDHKWEGVVYVFKQ